MRASRWLWLVESFWVLRWTAAGDVRELWLDERGQLRIRRVIRRLLGSTGLEQEGAVGARRLGSSKRSFAALKKGIRQK